MRIQDVDFKVFILVLAACFFIGAMINYFSSFHWLPAGLTTLAALLVNGIIISFEDRQPDGWDQVGSKNSISAAEYKKMLRMQFFSVFVVALLAIVSYAYTSN